MISALDSSVILDVLTADSEHAGTSEGLLRKASGEGRLIICECVLAEIRPAFATERKFEEFLEDWEIQFVPSSRESALLAGGNFALYLGRGGKGGRVAADFLIGAHAQLHADRLLARDRGYWRDYFRRLVVISR